MPPAVDHEGYLRRILKAHVYQVATETPLDRASALSRRLGCEVLFKREDLQQVYSFKLRGAFNRISRMSVAEREKGVICSSAGNHGQGVALAASHLGIPALVVMPETTPSIKSEAVRRLGAEVMLYGGTYDESYERARAVADDRSLSFVHPFDDPDVIAGQGTIAMEIFRQYLEPVEAILVPVGGGGLISGIALYARALYPSVRVIGVEPKDAASMSAALEAGRPVALDHVGMFADGVAVKIVGQTTFDICRELVSEMIQVDTDDICAAIQDIFEDSRAVLEPAGALAVAGLKELATREDVTGRTFVTLNCGANVNFDRLRHVAERAALGEGREMILTVDIPEQKGSFLSLCKTIGTRSVTEFNYRYNDQTRARIFLGVETHDGDRRHVLRTLEAAGYHVTDLSHDEVAKTHVRHMVGGVSRDLPHERVFRFEFPERPGALLSFLEAVGTQWNISLFHYRNHGSDYGRVLAGVQVPPEDSDDFLGHLKALGYFFQEETTNPAYRAFLTRSNE